MCGRMAACLLWASHRSRTIRVLVLVRPSRGARRSELLNFMAKKLMAFPWIRVSLAAVGLLMVIPGSSILIYPILWILMPSEQTAMVQGSHIAPLNEA